jgi:branched-chain amino acid transport system substrate-binding protein
LGTMSVTTPPRRTERRVRPTVLGVCLLLGCASVLLGCASAPRVDRPSPQDIRRNSKAYAAELEELVGAGRFAAADSLARVVLTADPENPQADEVLFIAARANHSLASWDRTIVYATELSTKFPLSPRHDEAMLLAAEAHDALGRHYDSAETLSRLLASPLSPEREEEARNRLRRLIEHDLTAADLERLVRAFPASPLAEEVSFKLAKAEFARGNYERSYALLADLLHQYPQHDRAREIRYLLEASAGRKEDSTRTSIHVELNTLGVLLPYTGEYSRFGRSFEEGVRMAIDEFNASAEIPAKYVLGDSKSDPIASLTAVRRLIVEDGVVAVIGSVFTVPSIIAAAECNAWRVPMVSPLVREAAFREIGTWVFQMQLPVEVEVAAMANLAVRGLLLERIAVLAPSTPEGRRLSEFFCGEIERLGGTVVSQAFFGNNDTDFREKIGAIRVTAPDALFVPGGPDQLVNILPQIRFYDVQTQLLGLSNWNSESLLRLAARELEGAVFPREGYYGRDPEVYTRFAAKYLESLGSDGDASKAEDVSPVTAAGYFGTRFVLEAIRSGAVDREQIKEYLEAELEPSGDVRLSEVESLPLLKVVSGKPREFIPPRGD